MMLELVALVFFCALVPQAHSQVDPALIMTMMNPDLKLPPKPPRSLFPNYYVSRQEAQRQQLEQRRRQEMEVYRRLQNMTDAQLQKLQTTLTKTQLRQLVDRLKYLKKQEEQRKVAQQQGGGGGTRSQGDSNTIMSGASRVRRPGSSANSVGSRGGSVGSRGSSSSSSSSSSRHRRPSTRGMHPMMAMSYFTKYRKKGLSSMTSGCNFPLMDPMESFFAFSRGGCRAGGRAVCFMKGMSCVNVEKSALCCPPGFTDKTLDVISYMKQMQAFMSQFQ